MGSWTDILTATDWVSPVLAVGQTLANGGGHTFRIPEACGYSGGDFTRALGAKGIKTWGQMLVSGHIMFTVKKEQKGLAISILQSKGMPTS